MENQTKKEEKIDMKSVIDMYKDMYNESNDQFIVMAEEILKLRKINAALNNGITMAISDLKRQSSDGSIACDILEKVQDHTTNINKNEFFNKHRLAVTKI